MRAAIYAIALLALLAVVAVVGVSGGVFSTTPPAPPITTVDLVAFVDLQGRVMAAEPDGSNPTWLSPEEGFYTWPTWSPDGRSVAFSGVSTGEGRRGPLTLFVRPVGEDGSRGARNRQPQHLLFVRPIGEDGSRGARAVFVNRRGFGPVLPSMPHYTLWSPDSRWLGIMANTPMGLSLLLDDPQDDEEAKHLLAGAPLYASWSANSTDMLVHAGLGHHSVTASDAPAVDSLDILAAGYRVPAWRPGSRSVAYVSETPDGAGTLYLDDPTQGRRTPLDETRGVTAFLWSPDGDTLAVAHSGQPSPATGGFVYRGVRLISPEGERRDVEIDEIVVAFFWSPNGRMIAYVTFAEDGEGLRWNVLDVASGQRWPLVDFIPTRDQMSLLIFFDQFAYSHRVWSPDSRAIVFAGGVVGNVGVSASLSPRETPRVLVLSVEPASTAQTLADGILATWSPR